MNELRQGSREIKPEETHNRSAAVNVNGLLLNCRLAPAMTDNCRVCDHCCLGVGRYLNPFCEGRTLV